MLTQLPKKLTTLLTALTLTTTLATTLTRAQDLLPSAPPQTNPIYLTNATIHTVSGDTIHNGTIAFTDGAITSITATMPRTTAPDAEVIDLTGKHIYPGLIAGYTRLGLLEVEAVRATLDYNETGGITPEARAVVAINPDSTLIPVTRLAGVLVAGVFPTGGRVPGTPGVIRTEGWTWEDMAITQNNGLVIAWPTMRTNPRSRQSESEQRDRIDRDLRAIDDLFSAAQGYAMARASDDNHPEDLGLEAVLRVIPGDHLNGADPAPVYITADDLDQITSAVRWATRNSLRPILIGGRDAPLASELLTSTNTPVIVTGTYDFPKRDDAPYDQPFTLPQRLAQAGIDFSISPTETDWNARNLAHNAGKAVAHGLDHDRAIRAITLDAARMLGIEGRYGSLEEGKSATLIVTDGDVLEVATVIEHAFIDGRRVDLRSKQSELAEKFRTKYRQLDLID